MNGIYKPKLLRVPVKFINGNWEYFHGGFLPMKEGAAASDFTANIMLEYSLKYTQKFVLKYLREDQRKDFSVSRG